MNSRKILIIIPSLGGGGAERVLINLLKSINLKKYRIDLFIGLKGGVLEKEIPNEVCIKYIFPNRKVEKLAYLLFIKFGFLFLFKLYGNKINKKYDVGLSFLDSYYTEFLYNNRAEISNRVTIIHSSYKSYSIKTKNINKNNISRFKNRYSKLDIIVSVASEAMQEFKNIFGEYKDMRVIYNPLNIKDILYQSNSKEAIDLNKNTINLIAVGSHFPVKGYDKLIKACSLLKIRNIDFTLNILGDGFLKNKHQLLIEELGMADQIFLKDFVSNPYKWIKESDVFVMTSEAEGLPTALCEAIILHKPVVVTNVPGCREVVSNGIYGMMAENNIKDISKKLEKLITSKKSRELYRNKSIERSEIFDDKIAIDKYLDIFNTVK